MDRAALEIFVDRFENETIGSTESELMKLLAKETLDRAILLDVVSTSFFHCMNLLVACWPTLRWR